MCPKQARSRRLTQRLGENRDAPALQNLAVTPGSASGCMGASREAKPREIAQGEG
jgi:hypothetical protein